MTIIKKTNIDNSIFKELNEKYPPVESENGVAYKQKLEYITFEIDFLSDPIIRSLRNKYGAVIIAVIFYLRTEMCKNGWKVRVDEGEYYNTLLQDCGYVCNIDMNQANQIINDLVEKRVMYIVQDNSVEEGKWMTCVQQLYNFEMASNNRKAARERQARRRGRQNTVCDDNQASQMQQEEQVEENNMNGSTVNSNTEYVITDNAFFVEENPFCL